MKTVIPFVALIALSLSGTASAGGWIHAGLDAGMGVSHTADLIFGDTGEVQVLVDGQPVSAPALPDSPVPLPATPGLPAVGLPALPAAPALPATPSPPATPSLPVALPLP